MLFSQSRDPATGPTVNKRPPESGNLLTSTVSRVGRPSKYSEEFRADAVALVLATEIDIAQGARDLGVNPETLRNWVKQAKIGQGQGQYLQLKVTWV